jgi:hypothetical protein
VLRRLPTRLTIRITEPSATIPMKMRNGVPSVDAPKAWIESRTPERTRNVPSSDRTNVAAISETFQILSIPRFSCTITECRNAVLTIHGISAAFSTASQAQYPPQSSSEYDHSAPSRMPVPRNVQAIIAKRRVERIQSAPVRFVISAPTMNANGIENAT